MANLDFGGELGIATEPKLPTFTLDQAKDADPGTEFLDPKGKKRVVPYKVKEPEEADALPEGAHFVDPQGTLRQTPKYEDIGFTAQTLYNMAVNDEERKAALERSYPGKVKSHPRTGEFYVEEDGGVRRKPKGFMSDPAASIAAQAAPVAGSIVGEIGGAVAGTVAGPVGTFSGAVAGGAAGGAVGQSFNDAIMGLAGVYKRTGGEEAEALGLSGAAGGVGSGVGRGIAAAAPVIKDYAGRTLPKLAAWISGADKNPEALATAIRLRGEGVLVPPSGWAPDLPHVQNIVEVFDPAMHTDKPLLQSATQHYESKAGKLVEQTGAEKPESLTAPKAAVSSERAGTAVLERVRTVAAAADARLDQAVEQNVAGVRVGATARASNLEQLRAAEAESRAAADKVINEGFKSIQTDIDTAMKATKARENSGGLWQQAGEKLRSVKTAIGLRATSRYNQADRLAGDNLPDIGNLPETASALIAQMPEGFERTYPSIVKQIKDMAGEMNEAGTGWEREPTRPTFGQLHQLRTALRNNVNWYDLTPDFKEGAVKKLAVEVDGILKQPGDNPALQAAAEYLASTDRWYGKVIRPLQDKNIQAVLNGLESGMPADPKRLYDTLIKEGRTELTNKVKKLVGPTLWASIAAADRQEMLNAAKTLTPGVIDGRAFVRQVLERSRSGMLDAVHGQQAGRLMEQARNIEMLDGRLPISVQPGDTIAETVAKARTAADAVKAEAKADPLAVLKRETRGIQVEGAKEKARLKRERKSDPLGFLHNPTVGATEAADTILGKEDLILAAAERFGTGSPEFEMLRQVYVQRILQGTLQPSRRLREISEEVQRIMFPGVSLEQMRVLAKDMDFLMATKSVRQAGKSIAATEHVEHPLGALPKWVSAPIKIGTLGLAEPIARTVLAGYFKMVRNIFNSPALMRFVEKGLKGDDKAREMVRELVQRRMAIGGPVGAGLAETGYQSQ